jgi:hypothetical protein
LFNPFNTSTRCGEAAPACKANSTFSPSCAALRAALCSIRYDIVIYWVVRFCRTATPRVPKGHVELIPHKLTNQKTDFSLKSWCGEAAPCYAQTFQSLFTYAAFRAALGLRKKVFFDAIIFSFFHIVKTNCTTT